MDITLTDTEAAALALLQQDQESPEDTLHRILLPFVAEAGEKGLQTLADTYRALSAADQLALTTTATGLRSAASAVVAAVVR